VTVALLLVGIAGSFFGAALPPWGFPGHRTVCEIAWRELTPEARAEVRRLTQARDEFDTFAESCVWADWTQAKAIHNAHWVNLQPGGPEVTMADCPTDCVLRHLETQIDSLRRTTNSDAVRARALMFVGHFVGDIHTPLHVAYGHDRGGNNHEIEGLGPDVDDLHGVWDSYITRDQRGQWRRFGQALHEDINPVDRTLWAESDPLVWANESFRVVEDYVYENLEGPGKSRLGAGYVEENRRTVERQLKKAGARLGALLNEVLTTP